MKAYVVESKRLAVSILVCVLSVATLLCMGSPAWAATVDVWGAQTVLAGDATSAKTQIDLVNMRGAAGETIFLSVSDGPMTLCKYLPHALGEDGQSGSDVADTFTFELPDGVSEAKLADGSYTVEAYASRGGDALYTGTLWGVWGRAEAAGGEGSDTTTFLIGTRVAGENDPFTFVAPTVAYQGSTPYRLVSNTPTMEGALAYFDYEPYDPADSVDGSISYVDQEGVLLKTDTIPGIPAGGSVTQEIPATITANGKLYRTMARRSSVTASNPAQTSFVVPCIEVGAAPFVCTIKMVDQDGNVIATDSLNVNDRYSYTVPNTIYKNVVSNGEERVVAYQLVDQAVWEFDVADQSEVVNGERVVTINYEAQEPEGGSIEVTFNQIDAASDRLMGTATATVTQESPEATPAARITVDGTTYVLAGSASDYAYTYGSGEIPVVNVYYVLEGSESGDPYTVTVNYINMTDGQTVASRTYTATPEQPVMQLETPATFDEAGVTYVRLEGQSQPIAHNYYSSMRTYAVYYRDSNDTLLATTVIERTRVVYDGVTYVGTTVTGAAGTGAAGGAAGTGATGGAQGGAGATTGLNPTTGYSAVGGSGDQTLVDEQGRDSNTERIEDTQNPLASGTEEGAEGSEGTEGTDAQHAGTFSWHTIVVLLGVLLGAFLIWLFLVKRRRDDDDEQEA